MPLFTWSAHFLSSILAISLNASNKNLNQMSFYNRTIVLYIKIVSTLNIGRISCFLVYLLSINQSQYVSRPTRNVTNSSLQNCCKNIDLLFSGLNRTEIDEKFLNEILLVHLKPFGLISRKNVSNRSWTIDNKLQR